MSGIFCVNREYIVSAFLIGGDALKDSFVHALSTLSTNIGTVGILLAFLLPIAVHEAGHIIAMLLLGMKLRGFRLELKGLCIEYDGGEKQCEIIAALSGPISGLLYFFAASYLSGLTGSQWLGMSADVSLILSFFNILPVYPLDGGAVFRAVCEKTDGGSKLSRSVNIIFTAIIAVCGLVLFLAGRGGALLGAGIWLLLTQSEQVGLVNRGDL